MSNLEIEYKTLLTKDEYQRLLRQMTHVNPVNQTNYYIDTPQFDLKANRMSLRIRTLPLQAELTLKVPEKVGNREYNLSLSHEEAKEILKTCQLPQSDILDVIQNTGINSDDLINFGQLTTLRREETTVIGKLALDLNQYATIVDYELELEVEDAESGEKAFYDFLEKNKITFKYAKSKVARFSQTLSHQK
ncbi:CYTH domain-containing protein [Streptococcus uberis]|uniref:CYTH domain-containing protein n=1 Tax=Streptococcus uberis TaxID=1349 RepID=UPI0021504108|nr:CYTH domain-containing protein [Streptococcus uberis]MCR4252625.1 CYTH domain-containing protein [Streptococcus uberis]MCR4254440.1 CYTH domain-containing protein [Streptococcus uberis]MCR4259093.1 CYTH domain-containing protein [Streptococcus uberis]MCR4261456.1 CYTH domain-containing protein [Streptococcus uberis]